LITSYTELAAALMLHYPAGLVPARPSGFNLNLMARVITQRHMTTLSIHVLQMEVGCVLKKKYNQTAW